MQYVATMIPKNLRLCSFVSKSTAQTSRSLVVYIVWFTVGANFPKWHFKAIYRFKEEHDWLHAAKTNIVQNIWILRRLSEIKKSRCQSQQLLFQKMEIFRKKQPTNQPANQATNQPTNQPTSQPANQPTNQPTSQPANQPTNQPAPS